MNFSSRVSAWACGICSPSTTRWFKEMRWKASWKAEGGLFHLGPQPAQFQGHGSEWFDRDEILFLKQADHGPARPRW